MNVPPETRSYATLSDHELVGLTFTERDQLPMAFAREAISRGARMIPPFAAVLRDPRNWERGDAGWVAVIHAYFLVGAIGGEKAIVPLIDALVLAEENEDDWIADELPSIFGAVGPAALARLRPLAADRARHWHLRERAMAAMAAITLRRPALEPDIFPFIAAIAADSGEDPETRAWAADILLDFGRAEYKTLLLFLLESGIASHLYDEKQVLEMGTGKQLSWYQRDWLDFYSPEKIAERRRTWDEERLNFNDAWVYAHAGPYDEPTADALEDESLDWDALPRQERRIGRNDPCPCGSGKKYKKCCLE